MFVTFFHIFVSFQKAELKQCDKNVYVIKSANQLIYEYYHDISIAELKAYALVQLAYMFYTVYNRGKYFCNFLTSTFFFPFYGV